MAAAPPPGTPLAWVWPLSQPLCVCKPRTCVSSRHTRMASQEKQDKQHAHFMAPDEEVFKVTNAHAAKDWRWVVGLLGSVLNLENKWDKSHHPRGVGVLGDLFNGITYEMGECGALLIQDACVAVGRASTIWQPCPQPPQPWTGPPGPVVVPFNGSVELWPV